jgi:hypothetical protein
MPGPTHATTSPSALAQFDKDIHDVHLIYDYDAEDSNGNPEKWRYEMYVSLVPYLARAMGNKSGGSSLQTELFTPSTVVPWPVV